jgi:hypothetical protein
MPIQINEGYNRAPSLSKRVHHVSNLAPRLPHKANQRQLTKCGRGGLGPAIMNSNRTTTRRFATTVASTLKVNIGLVHTHLLPEVLRKHLEILL